MTHKHPVVDRRCVECNKSKQETDFGVTNGYRRHICKKCRKTMMKRTRSRKSSKMKEMPWWIPRAG